MAKAFEMKDFDLTGKVAWVTGASYGIGFAIAKAFHAAGAKIVFNDRGQEQLDKGFANYKESKLLKKSKKMLALQIFL